MKRSIIYLWLCAMAFLGTACSSSSKYGEPSMSSDGDYAGDVEGGFFSEDGGYYGGDDNGNGQQDLAGKVTAGEWRDLDHWDLWSELMTNPDYGKTDEQQDETQQGDIHSGLNSFDFTSYSDYWQLYTNNRIAVRVKNNSGEPVADVPVRLMRGSGQDATVLYRGRTDNKGEVNLFAGLTQRLEDTGAGLVLLADGEEEQTNVSVTRWGEDVVWNELTTSVTSQKRIDIAFIVDATGSMSDEIDFLKADLQSIIRRVEQEYSDVAIRTAALFYRDEGDEYVTRASDFTTSLSTTVNFISKQSASGGGDYPEAVHTALEKGLQDLSWNEAQSVRLAFMLLDAPPHHDDNVIRSLHTTIPQYAEHGIRIIPVAASGVDKPTEFFLRFTAMATDATYVFITNDSGIGGEHIKATVGDYEVELLSDLMVRLINQYMD